MTTSGTGKAIRPSSFSRRKISTSGFSLLEIIVSLGVIGIVVTYFSFQVADDSAEEQLRAPAMALRKFARKAIRDSTAYREEAMITFAPGRIILSRGQIASPQSLGQNDNPTEMAPLPSGIQVQLKRAGAKKWKRPNGDVWRFQPAGLCEPLAVRFTDGKAFIELTFNPLTATVDEERAYFP